MTIEEIQAHIDLASQISYPNSNMGIIAKQQALALWEIALQLSLLREKLPRKYNEAS